MESATFPISPLLPAIADSLAAHPRLVLEAPPGAGKTTQVPLALLHAAWAEGRRIVMLEPRRVAARSAAAFMARQLGEAVGETVGYRIRFENKVGPRTRIEVVTEGILTRMIQDDPELGGTGPGGIAALLFDEFHERHLAADLGLALALDVQAQLREDLRIVVMSATLDGQRLADFLDAPRMSSEGRSFPVQVAHYPARREESIEAQARRATTEALARHPGDVLVFLPGQREIARLQAALEAAAALPADTEVLALHGELPVEQQSRVLQPAPDGRRRVVLATNVAESSVTLPGVRVVIDSGLAREPRFDPNSGFSRLDAVAISQASADQRAGRAGRVAEGWAWRLWPESQRLEAQRRPEIAQVELTGLALELASWGSDALRFVDPPPPGALAAARELLQRLGALADSGGLTAAGKRMLALGTHPRLAAMLLAARDPREQALAADLAALVEARDPLRSRGDALAERWRALAAFRGGHTPANASRTALAAIDAAARQWRRRLRCDATPPDTVEAHALGDLLAHAFPDRIAARHPADPLRYQLANGRMARLFDDSALRGEPWLVASELRFEARGDALLLRAAPVDEARLREDFPQRFVEREGAVWDPDRRALVARRESRFDRIVLDSRPAGRVDPAQAAQALTDAVRELGVSALPWTDALRQWQARASSLRQWMPELALPDVGDGALAATLDAWLRPAFAGKTRLDALSEEELGQALKSSLDWNARQHLDRFAPARIVVPSGMERRIDYALDDGGVARPPVLAVKLQELFGLADTPRVADGRVPVLLHLLSPGGKPLQVTGDLKGFWDRTYPEVKKEMKGRYPRHPWPDDPWSATATHRAKPRGT
ncbi:ATP-dependent helicase HrpB [Pseudoxanthomonas kaohsiungensis]|uniref:ATP-dependent helicase HrpB n=1 Tax=Pseudoxanthomonas kaohsiungensis TaxID=283923 RepID=A0ABW3LWN5_9GAMM|nr:ATP-dependent helicase HrpB [Pseudoxanthomonas kaohsiungensis]KAF1704610.1 ATP-dependent helicase HrpB [Pseudoxanthomonas kaohsiungensis]